MQFHLESGSKCRRIRSERFLGGDFRRWRQDAAIHQSEAAEGFRLLVLLLCIRWFRKFFSIRLCCLLLFFLNVAFLVRNRASRKRVSVAWKVNKGDREIATIFLNDRDASRRDWEVLPASKFSLAVIRHPRSFVSSCHRKTSRVLVQLPCACLAHVPRSFSENERERTAHNDDYTLSSCLFSPRDSLHYDSQSLSI